jgi:hypothetical protein
MISQQIQIYLFFWLDAENIKQNIFSIYDIDSDWKQMSQIGFGTILRPFLVLFLPTTFVFHKTEVAMVIFDITNMSKS